MESIFNPTKDRLNKVVEFIEKYVYGSLLNKKPHVVPSIVIKYTS